MTARELLDQIAAVERRMSWCPAGPVRDALVAERDALRERVLDVRARDDGELVIVLSVLVRVAASEIDNPDGPFGRAARKVLSNLSPAKPTPTPSRKPRRRGAG